MALDLLLELSFLDRHSGLSIPASVFFAFEVRIVGYCLLMVPDGSLYVAACAHSHLPPWIN